MKIKLFRGPTRMHYELVYCRCIYCVRFHDSRDRMDVDHVYLELVTELT